MDISPAPATAVPDHVRAAFGVAAGDAEPVATGSSTGWAVGGLVLSPAVDVALANWSARTRETVTVAGLRLAQPVRASDGRLVVGGWRADRGLAGRAELRPDESIAWALRVAGALDGVERPRLVQRRRQRPWSEPDVFAFAEAAAWDGEPEVDLAAGMEDRGTPFAAHRAAALLGAGALARRRRPVSSAPALVHGDLARGLLYSGGAEPVLADVVPYLRPPVWSAAVVAVDHLSWGVDAALLERWAHLPEWPQLVVRAAVFRLGVHAVHADSEPGAIEGLRRMTAAVEGLVDRYGGQ